MALMVAGLFAQTTVGQARSTASNSPATASGQTTANSVYTPLSAPARLLDSFRSNAANQNSTTVTVAGGSTGVPVGATAVVLTVTQAQNTGGNYVQAYPAGSSSTTSVVNAYFANQNTSNLVTVPVGTNGQVVIHSLGDCTLFVDEQGYYAAQSGSSTAGTYNPLTPARITDTRAGSGQPNAGNGFTSSNTTRRIQVTGVGGVPATGVSAAAVNLTVVNDASPGFLQAYPGPTRPTSPQTSNVNFNGGGQIVATRDIVTLDSTGGFTVYSNSQPVDLVVDVNGWFGDGTGSTTGSFFGPNQTPTRIYNTRAGGLTPIAAGGTITIPVAGQGGVSTQATAAALNITIDKVCRDSSDRGSCPFGPSTGPGSGFLTVFPGGTRPLASDLNFPPSSIVPNAVYATLAADGSISVYNGSNGLVDVIVDAFGFFGPLGSTGGTTTPFHVAVSANPNSVTADGSSTSSVSVVVTDANGNAVSGDQVSVAVTGTGCGTISNPNPAGSSSTSGRTDGTGHVTFTYTAGTAAGTCTLTATEAQNSQSGSATITQTGAGLTLTPATQSHVADGTTTATVTATAKNPDGTPRVGQTITFTITSGPNAGAKGTTNLGANPPGNNSNQCTTDSNGQCTFTYSSTKVGTDSISATYTNNSTGTSYTANAMVTWTPGAATKICLGPTDFYQSGTTPPNTFCSFTTSFSSAAQEMKINSQATVSATAYDANNNPVPGATIVFTRYFAPASAYSGGEAASNCDPAEGNNTSGCTVATNQSVTADASGHANYTFTESTQGQDEVRAQVQTATGQSFSGWTTVEWGLSSLTITPAYPAAFNAQQVGSAVTYNVTSLTDAGVPNTNCVELAFAENFMHQTPYADQVPPTSAYFASVSGTGGTGGANAYSTSGNCSGATSPITTFGPTNKTIYVVPGPNGTFSFTINSQAQTIASPIGATSVTPGGGDFETQQCNNFLGPCGPTAIGQTVQYGAPNTQSASIQPTSAASAAAGAVRDYTISNTIGGNDNTNPNFPNAVSFNELVNGQTTTPAVIAYTLVTVGSTTYCVQGYADPNGGIGSPNGPSLTRSNTVCPSGTTPETSGTPWTPAGSTQPITVKYFSYGNAGNGGANAFTEVQVKGTGTFSVRITDRRGGTGGAAPCNATTDNPNGYCTGTATPVTWIEQNADTKLETSEPNAVGGSFSWTVPVGSGLFLLTHNFNPNGPGNNDPSNPGGAEDRFSDGQFYNPPDATPTTDLDQDILAQVTDQSGGRFVGSTNYGVTWTITNKGATATHVYLQGASNADTTNGFVQHSPPSNGGPGGDGDLGGAVSHFQNPSKAAPNSNNTIPAGAATSGTYGSVAGSITVPGGSSLTFTTYTFNNAKCGNFNGSLIDCALIEIASGDQTQATVSAQLSDASSGTAIGGASATETYNWVTPSSPGDSVNGTIRAFDPVEPSPPTPDPQGQAVDKSDDLVVIHTTVGDRLVQFGNGNNQPNNATVPPTPATETYEVNGNTVNEDQFEAALGNGKTLKVTNFGCQRAGVDYAGNPQASCTGAQDNNLTG